MRSSTRKSVGWLAVAAVAAWAVPVGAQDWSQWRGPGRDGHAVDFHAPATWPDTLSLDWKVEVGEGHSSPIVAGDRVYLHSRLRDLETVSCLSLATGELLWRQTNPAPNKMNGSARDHGKGPKSTPVVADDRLFTLGITGILSCFDAASGELLWRWDSAGRFPATAPLFGTATSPVVTDGLVIVHLGGPGSGALMAFDAGDGTGRWRWNHDGPGYASPVVFEVDGAPQLVTQTEKHCLAVDPATGAELWRLPFTTPHVQNIVTPVSTAPGVVVLSGLEQGTRALRVVRDGAGWSTRTLWHNEEEWLYMASPVVADGRLYGLTRRDRGRLFCLDAATGATIWKGPGGQGDNVVFIDVGSALLMLTTEGRLVVIAKSTPTYAPLAEYDLAASPTWAHPPVAGDRVLIKDFGTLASWRVSAASDPPGELE